MEIRKLVGWFLLVLGAAKVFQAIHLQSAAGRSADALSAVLISLLIAGGAALLWLDKAPWRPRA